MGVRSFISKWKARKGGTMGLLPGAGEDGAGVEFTKEVFFKLQGFEICNVGQVAPSSAEEEFSRDGLLENAGCREIQNPGCWEKKLWSHLLSYRHSYGRKVAIKKIQDIFEHISDAARILCEIKLLRLLRHPDIVEIKHIMLIPSRREFKDIYVTFGLRESDLHQVIKANDDF